MTKPIVEPGRLVVSRQGRDAGRPMLIVKVIDEDYVFVADGDLRKLSNPKKKKLKHLYCKDVVHTQTAQALQNGATLLDSDIRRAIYDVFGCKDGQ